MDVTDEDTAGVKPTTGRGDATGRSGTRIIVLLYVVVVAITGFMGAVLGSIGLRDLEAVTFLGLVTFQPTPMGLAAFGIVTVGTTLGVVLLAVVGVSRRYVDE